MHVRLLLLHVHGVHCWQQTQRAVMVRQAHLELLTSGAVVMCPPAGSLRTSGGQLTAQGPPCAAAMRNSSKHTQARSHICSTC